MRLGYNFKSDLLQVYKDIPAAGQVITRAVVDTHTMKTRVANTLQRHGVGNDAWATAGVLVAYVIVAFEAVAKGVDVPKGDTVALSEAIGKVMADHELPFTV